MFSVNSPGRQLVDRYRWALRTYRDLSARFPGLIIDQESYCHGFVRGLPNVTWTTTGVDFWVDSLDADSFDAGALYAEALRLEGG